MVITPWTIVDPATASAGSGIGGGGGDDAVRGIDAADEMGIIPAVVVLSSCSIPAAARCR